MSCLLVVSNDSGVWRIIANKYGVAVGPATAAFNALLYWSRRNKGCLLRKKLRGERAPRRNIIDNPDPAAMRGQNKIVFTGLNREIAHRHRRKPTTFELRPSLSAINRNVQAKLSSKKKQARFHDIFLDDVRVTSNTLRILRGHEQRPRFPKVSGAKSVRCHVTKSMAIEGDVGSAGVVVTGLDPTYPGVWRKAGNVSDHIVPALSSIAGQLQVAIVGSHPDHILVLGRFADGINSRVHLRRGVIDRDSARLFLFLFLRIIRRQIRRNAFPTLTMIARAKEKLRAHIEGPFLVRRKRHRGVPIPAQFFLVVWLGLNVARFVGVTIYPTDITALVFGIDVIGIAGIRETEEAITSEHVFPSGIGNPTGILRVPDPAAVILQSPIDPIRILVVDANMIELRDRKIIAFPPFAPAVVGIPHPAIIAGKNSLRIGWIDPDTMNVAVYSAKPANRGEAFPRVLTNNH